MKGGFLKNKKKKGRDKERDFDLDTMFEELEIDVGNC